MSKKKSMKAFSLLVLSIVVFNSFSQRPIHDNNLLSRMAPSISSPTAASIEKYIEFPTENYTGVPSIGLPLYEIQLKGVKIPIALSYHAGGIKVDDIASDVGLGWTLQTGGVVSILANGLRDEQSRYPSDTALFTKIKNLSFQIGYSGGYVDCEFAAENYSDPVFGLDWYSLYGGADIDFLRGVVQQNQDSEPDLYTFNFLGRGGKFFRDKDGVFRSIPYSELKIEEIRVSNLPAGYKITDENGTVYEFKAEEGSTENIFNSATTLFIAYRYATSYYLSKVTTVNGETVDFYYSGHPYTYDAQKSFNRSKTTLGSTCWQFNTTADLFSNSYTATEVDASGFRIDSIKTSDGTLLKFVYSSSNRTDMPSKKLDSIQVWSYMGGRNKIKDYYFTYDYSLSKLTLKSVKHNSDPVTEFTYNTDGSMPPRLSYAQDHYGYYNGKELNNSYNTLLPMDEYMEFWVGADRSVDTNYTQAAILTKIKHPTGGTTKFTYEPNQYYVSDTTIEYPKVIRLYKVSSPDATVSDTFTVTSAAKKIRIDHTNSYDGTQIHNDYCIIHLTGPNSYSRDFVGNSTRLSQPLELEPGLYTLSIENVGSTYSAEATLFWFQETAIPPHNQIGGGVRIKEVAKSDSLGNPVMTKKFEYVLSGTNKSSGVNTYTPLYLQYSDTYIKKQGSSTTNCTTTYCPFVEQSSSPIFPMAFSNGNPVSYKEVKVYMNDSTQNGYTTYKYHVDYNGMNLGLPSLPFAPRIMFDWTNGSLLEETQYGYKNNTFSPVRKVKNFYNYLSFDPEEDTINMFTTYGLKVGVQDAPFICWGVCAGESMPLTTTFDPMSFAAQRYQLYTSWHRIDSTAEVLYFGNDSLLNTTRLFYESANHINPTKSRKFKSNGERIIEVAKYPSDYSNYGFIYNLRSKNVISSPIEKIVLLEDAGSSQSVVSGEIVTYKPLQTVPDKVYALEITSPIDIGSFSYSSINSSSVFSMYSSYKEKAAFEKYDSLGNILQLRKTNDVIHNYMWDHYLKYPTAYVVNADTSSIAYSSFESDGKGGLTFAGSITDDASSPTGGKCYYLYGNDITKSSLPNKTYIVSYWSKSGSAYSVNGSSTPSATGKTVDGWTYFEHQITGTSITISGSNYIDEVRIYPKGAFMTTYTYKPLVGITSECDHNNRITYYEYDSVGRVRRIKDQDKNIVKVFEYQYQTTSTQQ